MKVVKCMIVDDEPLAREKLESFIARIPGWELTGSLASVIEAYATIQLRQVTLMFLDIKMPVLNGVDFLASLKKPPLTVFTTAFEKYAMDGHELNVIDYLLKPISFDRFLKTAERVNNFVELKNNDNITSQKLDFLFVRQDDKLIKIDLGAILYLEAMNDYVKIHTNTATYLVNSALKTYEEQLPVNKFIRIHRSFIVSLTAVTMVRGNVVYIAEKEVPIGNFYREEFLKIVRGKQE